MTMEIRIFPKGRIQKWHERLRNRIDFDRTRQLHDRF